MPVTIVRGGTSTAQLTFESKSDLPHEVARLSCTVQYSTAVLSVPGTHLGSLRIRFHDAKIPLSSWLHRFFVEFFVEISLRNSLQKQDEFVPFGFKPMFKSGPCIGAISQPALNAAIQSSRTSRIITLLLSGKSPWTRIVLPQPFSKSIFLRFDWRLECSM